MSRIKKFGRIFLSYEQVELTIAEVVYYGINKRSNARSTR